MWINYAKNVRNVRNVWSELWMMPCHLTFDLTVLKIFASNKMKKYLQKSLAVTEIAFRL